MINIEEMNAADALLDKRLRISLPAPWMLRLVGKKMITYWAKRPVYQNLLNMARITAKMGLNIKDIENKGVEILFPMIAEHGVDASRVIAYGMIRGAIAAKMFNRPLAYYLRCHMNARRMAELMKLIVVLSGGEDFVSIIRSAITLKVTTPTLSQTEEKGS